MSGFIYRTSEDEREKTKGKLWKILQHTDSFPHYRRELARLVRLNLLSPECRGNYSLIINGQPCNYHLDGKELFIVEEADASNLVIILKKGRSNINVCYTKNN